METHHFGYTASSQADLSSSYPNSMNSLVFESTKFGSGTSPDSPFSTSLEAEVVSSRDNLSESTTFFSKSSTDHHNLLHSSPVASNPFCRPDNLHAYSSPVPALLPYETTYGVEMQTLIDLENALMDSDYEVEEVASSEDPFINENRRAQTSGSSLRQWNQSSHWSNQIVHYESFEQELPSPSPSNLKQLLIGCAKALSDNNLAEFHKLVEHVRQGVSINGEPIQRLGAYMLEGLVSRTELSGTKIYRALKCNQPESKDLLSYMHILYEICPYLKFGYMAANGAIAEACKNEDQIHIVDFQIAQGTQWMTLLQALAARPGGPPHVRITGIDDPVSKHARGSGLELLEKGLAAVSEKFKIPIEFHPVPVFAPDVTLEMLQIQAGAALAVNFPLQLHHTPDESVDVTNPRDGLLRMIRSLNPKVVTLVEQESNTNTARFLPRFIEALDFYSAMFESIDVMMERGQKERINVEQHCLARDIVNIIACEGKERVERHELLGKWRARFMMAGFRPFPLNSYVNSVIGELLKKYSENYTLVERDGAMLLGWKHRDLVSASAWN